MEASGGLVYTANTLSKTGARGYPGRSMYKGAMVLGGNRLVSTKTEGIEAIVLKVLVVGGKVEFNSAHGRYIVSTPTHRAEATSTGKSTNSAKSSGRKRRGGWAPNDKSPVASPNQDPLVDKARPMAYPGSR